ncbi:DNA mismatch endonuclease Vsr [Rhodopseudomonas palustris]|nr:DNA mismatch endonuclease Vsr [Rhodopseudomonas palustris]
MNETSEDRRRIMRAVKSFDTKPELSVRKLIHRLGYRYRLHRVDLPGKPDLVFPSRRKVIFVHGCFWHGHDCPRGARPPKTNAQYWEAKIARNRERDRRTSVLLEKTGWRSFVVWECCLRNSEALTKMLVRFLDNGNGEVTPDQPQVRGGRR